MYVDVVIVGGGIIGMSLANHIKEKNSLLEVVLCEKDSFLGDQVSSRNSGVLHSGIYYKNNSEKHLLTRRGLELWDEQSRELGFEINRCGKYIVSDDFDELTKLRENGLRNQVKVEEIVENQINIEKVTTQKYSMFLPETSVVNVSEVIKKLENKLLLHGVIVLKKQAPTVKDDTVFIDREKINCSYLINAAGLGAVEFRKMVGLEGIKEYFVRGDYLYYRKSYYSHSLVYPLPNKKLNTLGVHTCIASDGSVFFGPDAKKVESISYIQNNDLITPFYDELSKTFKGISFSDLTLGFAGIRPKVEVNGVIQDDFLFNSIKMENYNYIELLGIESPGLTCCFSIAEKIVNNFLKL